MTEEQAQALKAQFRKAIKAQFRKAISIPDPAEETVTLTRAELKKLYEECFYHGRNYAEAEAHGDREQMEDADKKAHRAWVKACFPR